MTNVQTQEKIYVLHHALTMLFILLTVLCLTPRYIYGDPARPNRVNVDVGLSVVLPCDAKNSNNVMWEFETKEDIKNPKELASSGEVLNGGTKRYTLLPSARGLHDLLINKSQSSDAGIYICTENNGAGTKHYVVLIVNGNGFKSRTIAAGSGSPAVLPCDPETKADVKWEFEDTYNHTLIELASKGEFIDGHEERFTFAPSANGNQSLRIRVTQTRDAGLYICTEDNGGGTKHYVILKIDENVSEPTVPTTNSALIISSIIAAAISLFIAVIAIVVLLLKARKTLKYVKTRGARQQQESCDDALFSRLPEEMYEFMLKKAVASFYAHKQKQLTNADVLAVSTFCSVNSKWKALLVDRKYNRKQLRQTFNRLSYPCPDRLPMPVYLVYENNEINSFTILGNYVYTIQGSWRTELRVFDAVNYKEQLKQTLDNVKQPTNSVGSRANNCIYLGDSINRCIWSVTPWKPGSRCESKTFYDIPTGHIIKSISAADDGRLIVLIAIEEFSGKTWRGRLDIMDADGKRVKVIDIWEDIVCPSSVAITDNNTYALSGIKMIWLLDENGHKVSKQSTFSEGIEFPCSVRFNPDNRTMFVADSGSGKVLLFDVCGEKLVLRKTVKKWEEYRTIQANRSFNVSERGSLLNGGEKKNHAISSDRFEVRNVPTVRIDEGCSDDDDVQPLLSYSSANAEVSRNVARKIERYQKRPVRVVGDSDKLIVGLNSGEILVYKLR